MTDRQVPPSNVRAVRGAIAETRRQWRDFQQQLKAVHGVREGSRIACALTHDAPVTDCT
ncbi:hypothetical protein ACFY97_19505 [Streptomyces klenkii]|uniref:hypothetical protein n=1 Tax=Streptomyces klenkii TaxID=1420899 RepID=UPI0036E3AFD1